MTSDKMGSDSSIWDKEAKTYDGGRASDPVYESCIKQATKQLPPGISSCLDAGCGTGLATAEVAKRAKTVIAVDYSLESLKLLKEKGLPNVLPVLAEVTALPFLDSSFDHSTCINTLQHLQPGPPHKKTLKEMRRVTKRNCKILVTVHHFSNGKRKAGWIKEGKPGQPGIDYIFRFTREDLFDLMPNACIGAVGFYGLCRIRFIGCHIQNLVARLFGKMAAKLGFGHMLIGVERNEK